MNPPNTVNIIYRDFILLVNNCTQGNLFPCHVGTIFLEHSCTISCHDRIASVSAWKDGQFAGFPYFGTSHVAEIRYSDSNATYVLNGEIRTLKLKMSPNLFASDQGDIANASQDKIKQSLVECFWDRIQEFKNDAEHD